MSLPRRPLCILAGKVDAVTEDLWPTTNKAGHVLNNNFSFSPFLIIKLKCFHLSVFVLHVLYFYHKHKRPITRYLSWSRQTRFPKEQRKTYWGSGLCLRPSWLQASSGVRRGHSSTSSSWLTTRTNSRNIIPGLVGEMTVSMIEHQTYLRLTLAHPFPGGLSSSSLSSFPSGVSFLDPCRPLFPAAASWKPVSGRAKRYVFIKATTHPFTEQRRKNCGENHRTRTWLTKQNWTS